MDRDLVSLFGAPPISVLDVKQSYWKARRQNWNSMGLNSSEGRQENLLKQSKLLNSKTSGTSIFDPVLCELLLNWFSKEGDVVYDPFAGGNVRGIVSSYLGRHYIGVDVRKGQVETNRSSLERLDCCSKTHKPKWVIDDGTTFVPPRCNFILTCPPYYDLEVYSDQANDLSTMNAKQFESGYLSAIEKCAKALRKNSFAAWVVGDVRGPDGFYLGLPQKTVSMFESVGLKLYNEMVLLQEPATAAMRSFKYMNTSRKIAKCHQNVLVFCKGSPSLATKRLGSVNIKHKQEPVTDSMFG